MSDRFMFTHVYDQPQLFEPMRCYFEMVQLVSEEFSGFRLFRGLLGALNEMTAVFKIDYIL